MAKREPIPQGGVVLLGGNGAATKGRVGAQIAAIPRVLDDNGTYEVKVAIGPDGQPMPVSARAAYLDAEQLLAAIRDIVREELSIMFRLEMNIPTPGKEG